MFNSDVKGTLESKNDVLPSNHSIGLVFKHVFTNRLS